jgi:Fe-S-cluster-containing hydrogenase component 2
MWFKVIAGASHTDLDGVVEVARAFASAGIDCLDITAHPAIIEAVDRAWRHLPVRPQLMVSLALDDDLHFRKIALDTPACITCGACVPACPANAFSVQTLPAATTGTEPQKTLELDQPRCYGCDRCMPLCPTEALTLVPYMPADTWAALAHPAVTAVELHTRHADQPTLAQFVQTHGALLQGKRVSVCFSPQQTADWWPLVQWMADTQADETGIDWMLQIDGKPMSGTPAPDASLPALAGAQQVHSRWCLTYPQQAFPFFMTVSGGINTHTARYMQQDAFAFIDGVAMGTMARQWLQAGHSPHALVQMFKSVCRLPVNALPACVLTP